MSTPVNLDASQPDGLGLPPGCHDVAWSLPAEAGSPSQARTLTRHTLTAWKLEPLLDETELLVSEVVTNAVQHGGGPIGLRFLLDRASKRLRCEVTDTSPEQPQLGDSNDEDESGRGLMIVEALADQWGSTPTETGKTIWFERTLPE